MKRSLIAMLILAGCGREEAKPPAPVPVPVAPVAVPKAPPKGAGTLKGTVKLAGKAPRPRKLAVDGDPKCAAMHATAPVSEEAVVDPEGRVQWVLVYVRKGAEGVKYETPSTPVVLDQKGCMYHPHVFGMMTGQKLLLRNSDPLSHNVHGLPAINKEFNIGQNPGQEDERAMTAPEVVFKVKCDIHPWMAAWAGVLDHPFFAVTDAAGGYSIPGLPAGKYVIEAWHETFGTASAEVEVKEGEEKSLEFTLGKE